MGQGGLGWAGGSGSMCDGREGRETSQQPVSEWEGARKPGNTCGVATRPGTQLWAQQPPKTWSIKRGRRQLTLNSWRKLPN